MARTPLSYPGQGNQLFLCGAPILSPRWNPSPVSVLLGGSVWSPDRHWAVMKVPCNLTLIMWLREGGPGSGSLTDPFLPPAPGPTHLDFWGALTQKHSCSPHSALSSLCFPDPSLSIRHLSPPQRVESCRPIPPGLRALAWGSRRGLPVPILSPLSQQLWMSPKRETHLASQGASQFLRV